MIHHRSRVFALILSFSVLIVGTANESPTAGAMPKDGDAVIEELTAKKVNVAAFTMKLDGYVPTIGLGNGPNGDPEANANDETLALVVQLPEVERIFINGGKISADGFAQLALLPKLRSLNIYASDIGPTTFAVLTNKLTTVETPRIQNCPVTDEILGYAGAIRCVKVIEFNKTQAVSSAT